MSAFAASRKDTTSAFPAVTAYMSAVHPAESGRLTSDPASTSPAGHCRTPPLGAHHAVAALLLARGADAAAQESMALVSAATGGHLSLVALLLARGATRPPREPGAGECRL